MKELIKITIIDREGVSHVFEIPPDIGISVMELCKANDLPVLATCGGMALCATCHVLVESGTSLPEMQNDEALMLDQLPNMEPNSRLSCQLKINEKTDGLVVRLAEE
ncbi:MAG: 2Fe-2S iron-sulfur cluster binding domain-containing protein [Saprospiraceae bacterium]|nr:2Fe-2S iron-sulfur cluster binding domain-containing protein [Saprospiraceae bacterium]